jgi:CHAT domain-containing protein/tetratricopeptide (TPR) repeat protein
MVRLSFLGLMLSIAVLSPMVVPEGTIAMQPGTVAQVNGRKVKADRLLQEGDRLVGQEQYSEALGAFQKALEIYRGISDHKGEGYTLRGIGNVHLGQKDYKTAIDYQEKALAIARKINDADLKSRTFNNLGLAYRRILQSKRATFNFQEGLRIAEENNNSKMIILLIDNLTDLYKELKLYDKAINLYEKSASVAKKIGNHELEAKTLLIIGYIYNSELYDYSRALEYYKKSIKASENLPEVMKSRLRALPYMALSDVYFLLGDYQNAIDSAEKSLAIGEQNNNLEIRQYSTLLLIAAYYGKDPSRVENFIQISLDISKESKNLRLNSIANAYASWWYSDLRNYSKASQYAQKALEIANKNSDSHAAQIAHYVLGGISGKQNDVQQAIIHYQLASLGNPIYESRAKLGLAQTYRKLNRLGASIAYYKQVVISFERIRSNVTSSSLAQQTDKAFLNSVQGFDRIRLADIYRELADVLLSQGQILEAQQILELLQVEELKDATPSLRIDHKPSEVVLNPLQQDLINRHGSLIAFGYDLEKCRIDKCDRFSTLDSQFTKLQNQYNTFLQKFDSNIRKTRYEDEAAFDPKKLDSVYNLIKTTEQKTQEKTVFIYPFVAEQQLWLVWFSASGIRQSQAIAIKQPELAKAVLEFRQLMGKCEKRICGTEDTTKLQTVSSKLYDWLIRPIEPELTKNEIRNLIFTLDRTVRYIPMGALYDNQQKQYLAQKYTVSTVLSAELTQAVDRAPFTRDQTQVLALGTAQGFPTFSPLFFVPIETGTIVRSTNSTPNPQAIFPGNELLDNKFNAATLRTEILDSKYRIAHLATHGKFIPGSPLASFLLTGDGKEFTIADIQNLNILSHLDLIVLSACESALGGDPNKLDGIEISSMSYHFLNKQAKSVLASLWKVSDPSTALFMQQFYTHLANGKTKAQAVQQVQKDFIDRKLTPKEAASLRSAMILTTSSPPLSTPRDTTPPDYSHPFYWAPFILIGNNL